FLHRAAERRPVVLLFDDVQRADPPSLRLLAFVAHQIDTTRILIVGALRPPIDIAREIACELIELGGLPVPEVAGYVESRTRARAPDWLAGRLHEHTGGNPLFLRQIVQAVEGQDGPPRWESLATPDKQGLRGAIDRHLAALPSTCRELLKVAA